MPFSSVLGASTLTKPGVATSATRPANPFNGQVLYETDTAKIVSWNGSAWVYTAAAGGLVPITPTSIAVGGGTATSAGSGQVTFTGVGTNLSLNGVFSSAYTNYSVLFTKLTATGTGGVNLRLRASGTDSATTYDSPRIFVENDSVITAQGQSGVTSFTLNGDNDAYAYYAITLFSPNVNAFTGMVSSGHENDGSTGFYFEASSGQHQTAYQADGISFIVTGGATVSGTVSVYGYAI